MQLPIISTRFDHVNVFINSIAPIVCNEWMKRKKRGEKRISPAVVIAQAGKESGWNLNAKTLFGIKGAGQVLDTTEFISGEYVNVADSFRMFPDIASAVSGYYDLMQWSNYDDATSATTVEDELRGLTNDDGAPYATAPDYYETTLEIINDFGLRVFNDYVVEEYNEHYEDLEPTKSNEEIAQEVIHGDWGNGEERRERLTNAGYDYDAIQSIVNDSSEDTNDESDNSNDDDIIERLADEVYRGEWGNNPERRQRLEEAGYNYDEVQNRMEEKYYN